MHELQVAGEIIEVVEREMIERGLTRVEAAAVRIGALSCVHPDALAFSFEAAVAGTKIHGTRLQIDTVPVRARCNACGRESEIETPLFSCAHCSGNDLEIIAGEELYIDYLIGD